MNFIFTFCGNGVRFLEKGFTKPKFLLKLNDNRTIIEHIMAAITFPEKSTVHFLFNEKYRKFEQETFSVIEKITLPYGFTLDYNSDTTGQAETAFIAISQIDNDQPIIIMNNDTIIKQRNFYDIGKRLHSERACYVDLFEPEIKTSDFSYAKKHGDSITEIKEKQVISDYASSGLYGFSSGSFYKELYCTTSFYNNEKYISQVIEEAIIKDSYVFAHTIYNENQTIILGTPEQYHSHINR
ncbi:sugar phosphate nucleotidyltransferase [Erwinia oleae]|uniref:sugar phosphate nucleotidyltransferase n=1 Tax=Erwinia oleae TaxID=796334 RepID=UPI00054DEE85|nr:sugar phosphate nucleotidyltransferase [Erwinia oleae]